MREISLDRTHFSGLATEVLESSGTFRFRARGSSMCPFIKDGDILEVQPVDVAAIRRADVILYRREAQHLVAHRVVGTSGDGATAGLVLQGDADLSGKERVPSAAVLGRVARVQRGDKRIITLDAGLWHWLGRVWVVLSPFSRGLYRALLKCWLKCGLRKPVRGAIS